MSTETVDDILAHYGVLGMKWGVRRSDAQLARAAKKEGRQAAKTPSDDSAAAEASRKKVRAGGVAALSNKELQNLNNRMNLEQNYSRLANPKNSSRAARGLNAVKSILGVTKTANEIYNVVNSPMMKEFRDLLK